MSDTDKPKDSLGEAITKLEGWARDYDQIAQQESESADCATLSLQHYRRAAAKQLAREAMIRRDAYLHAIRILKGEA